MRAVVLVALVSSACAVCPVPGPTICPAVEIYSPAENVAIAAELHALQADDVLVKIANEDERLRSELRACRAAAP